MSRSKEISVEEYRKFIGEELFAKSQEYILAYFPVTNMQHRDDNIQLKVIKNSDGSFSIYEDEFGMVIVSARRCGNKRKYVVLPIGIARAFNFKILQQVNNDLSINFDSTIYRKFFNAIDLPDNEGMDLFLYYVGTILVDSYFLDYSKAQINIVDQNKLILSAPKFEFYYTNDKQTTADYGEVCYFFRASHNSDIIKVKKVYTDYKDVHLEPKIYFFDLKIEDLINWLIDDTGTGKGKEVR